MCVRLAEKMKRRTLTILKKEEEDEEEEEKKYNFESNSLPFECRSIDFFIFHTGKNRKLFSFFFSHFHFGTHREKPIAFLTTHTKKTKTLSPNDRMKPTQT